MNIEYRTCKKCGETKELRKFKVKNKRKDGTKYRTYICTYCDNRKRDLKRKYGLEEADYNRMLQEQEFKCKICGSETSHISRKNKLDVDHCHVTGKVRGLLCNTCNKAIGYFKDKPELIRRALKYVETVGEEV